MGRSDNPRETDEASTSAWGGDCLPLLLRAATWVLVVVCVVVLKVHGDDLNGAIKLLLAATAVAVVVERRVIRTA